MAVTNSKFGDLEAQGFFVDPLRTGLVMTTQRLIRIYVVSASHHFAIFKLNKKKPEVDFASFISRKDEGTI